MDVFSEPEENYRTGYIKLYRSVMDHHIFKSRDPFSRLEAWIDILSQVNHKSGKMVVKNSVILIERGESLNSLDTWAKRWKWDKSKVRRFLTLLESDSMIVLKGEQISTRLTVCNYDTYQSERNATETQAKRKRNATETQTTSNNNDKKDKNVNNGNNVKDISSDASQSDGIYPTCINLYNNFIIQRTGVGAKFNSLTGSSMKKIIDYLKGQVKNKDDLTVAIPEALNAVFTNYESWQPFHKQQLNLNQIESNLINIINSIKNGKSITEKQQPQSKYANS